MTSDKSSSMCQTATTPQCHPQRCTAALWNILRSAVWAHGRDMGLGGHSHSNSGFFNPALLSLLLLPVHLGTNLGNTPRKIWSTTFLLQFWTNLLSHAHEGAAGQHRAGDSPGQGAQSPSTKLALSTAAGGSGRNSRSHTHTHTTSLLSTAHTVSVFQIKTHSNHQSQEAGSNPPAAMSQETRDLLQMLPTAAENLPDICLAFLERTVSIRHILHSSLLKPQQFEEICLFLPSFHEL